MILSSISELIPRASTDDIQFILRVKEANITFLKPPKHEMTAYFLILVHNKIYETDNKSHPSSFISHGFCLC